jgi:hypothetical protein
MNPEEITSTAGRCRKFIAGTLSAGLLSAVCWTSAAAALLDDTLGVPIIAYDQNGVTTYQPGPNLFSVTATPFQIFPSAAPITAGPNGQLVSVRVVIDSAGNLTGGVPGDDLAVTGEVTIGSDTYSGVLLTGEVSAFGYRDSGGPTDFYDFRFTVTGGKLAALYGTNIVGMQVTSENSDFIGDFTKPITGGAKGNIGRLPPTVAALGDRVWEDRNANGIQDCQDTNGNGILGDVDPLNPGNPAVSDQGPECGGAATGGAGIAGVPVNLFQPDGNGDCTIDLGRQVVTGSDGLYLFDNLNPGDYCVKFDITALPADFCKTDGFALGAPQFTAPNVGGDPAIDSDADPATGTTDGLTLAAGETNRTLDAGIVCPAKIGDRVWDDKNKDGLQDDGEPGVAGVTVELFDCGPDGVAGTEDDINTGESRVTDAIDGLYMFGAEPGVFDLEPGRYYVKFDPTTFPAGFDFTVPKVGSDDTIDSDCLPPDGITSCVTLGSRGINLNRDCGIVAPPPNCDLELDKKCRVETPPSGDLACEAKIAATVLKYTGAGTPATVTVEGKNSKAQVVSSFNGATGILSIDARPEDLGSKMTITTDGVAEVIHTSCSTPYVAGQPAPLDNPKGDPSENWFVLSFVDKNGTSVSVPGDDDGMFTDNCTFTPGPAPSCDTLKADKQKLSSLTFAYTGGGCPGDNDQGNKSSCSGSIDPNQGVTVQAGEKVDNLNYPVLPSFVAPNEEFTIDPDKFKSDSVLVASNAGGTETNGFHTSCSQPLAVGDVFGSFTVVAINGQRGSTDVTYQYVVTNKGDPLTNVLVTDVPLGAIGGPIDLATGQSQTFTKLAQLVGTTVNTGTASGVLADGEVCSDSDTVTVEAVKPPPKPAECKELKPIDALILQYDASQAGGRSIEQVSWYRDKYNADDPTKNLINTIGPVSNGQVVNFDGFAAAKAKNDVDFFIQFTDGSSATSRFHRSCSDDEMNDITDCGTLQGNGKDDTSGLNTWVLRDLAGNGKVLGCP